MSDRVDYSRLDKTLFTRARLNAMTVVVVGAGALGNELIRLLGLLAPGRAIVVDPDRVEPTNLPRASLFRGREALGRLKTDAVVDAAKDLFPDTEWTGHPCEIADMGFEDLASAHVIFGCVDSDLARLETAYIAMKLAIPFVDGGLGRQNHARGRVTFFPGTPSAACYGCLLTATRRRELLQVWDSTSHPCMADASADEDGVASTPTMAAITAALQVETGFRELFAGDESATGRAMTVEVRLDPLAVEQFQISPSVSCPFHSMGSARLERLPFDTATCADLLESLSADTLVLDWPVCMDAECVECGHRWVPAQRLARLRRHGRCAQCGSARLQERQTLRSIDRNSPFVRSTPRELGLPARHLYDARRRPVA